MRLRDSGYPNEGKGYPFFKAWRTFIIFQDTSLLLCLPAGATTSSPSATTGGNQPSSALTGLFGPTSIRGSGGGGSLLGSPDASPPCSAEEGAGTGGKARLVIEDGSACGQKKGNQFIRMALQTVSMRIALENGIQTVKDHFFVYKSCLKQA